MKLLISFAVAMLLAANTAYAAPISIKSGTSVIVALTEGVSSASHKTGDNVLALVIADVVVDDQIVIPIGARVMASISHADDAGAIGEGGEVNIQFSGVYAVDGTFIPTAGSKSVAGDDETTGTVVVGVVLCPLALLNEGDEAEIGANTQVRLITIANAVVDPSKAR